MSLEGGEAIARAVQQTRKACVDARTAIGELGTARDGQARDKLRRIRQHVQQYDEKCTAVLVFGSDAGNPELKGLQDQYVNAKAEFNVVNAEALRKEKQIFKQQGPWSPDVAPQAQQHEEVRVESIKQIDLSEFRTEEATQREKLWNAREIESDVMDLKTTYQEFSALVQQQQSGVDIITDNVTTGRALIETGHQNIQQSSRYQKKFRKVGYIVAIVFAIALVIVAIVLVSIK